MIVIQLCSLISSISAADEESTVEHLKNAPGFLLLGAGVPVQIGGHYYGAIGVSGAPAEKISGDVDDACARAGIDAIREDIEFAE